MTEPANHVAAGSVRLSTVCGHTLWAGFFGIDQSGNQPECQCEIVEDVDVDCLEIDATGTRPCYSVECPSCGAVLEWPQEWEIVETAEADQ
jgi:hypothetical protein